MGRPPLRCASPHESLSAVPLFGQDFHRHAGHLAVSLFERKRIFQDRYRVVSSLVLEIGLFMDAEEVGANLWQEQSRQAFSGRGLDGRAGDYLISPCA